MGPEAQVLTLEERRALSSIKWGLLTGRGWPIVCVVAGELRETVAALKHDLAKSVAWRSANLEPGAWAAPMDAACVDALVGDLLFTRRRAGSVESAWQVWERLSADLVQPYASVELTRVAAAIEVLRGMEPILRSRDVASLEAAGGEIRAAQSVIRHELAALHRRLVRGNRR